jgi:hypothetical protein
MYDTLRGASERQRIAMFRLRLALLATLLALGANAEAATKAIRFGKLWDGHNTIHNQHYFDRADDAYKFSPEAKRNLLNLMRHRSRSALIPRNVGHLLGSVMPLSRQAERQWLLRDTDPYRSATLNIPLRMHSSCPSGRKTWLAGYFS